MRVTHVRVLHTETRFQDVRLDRPFTISGRPITHFTTAEVRVEVVTCAGARVQGRGTSTLSVPWAWPSAPIDVDERDGALRSLVRQLAAAVTEAGPGDPIQIWHRLYADLDRRLAELAGDVGCPEVPRLAGLLALGAVDNAVHDAWGRAQTLPSYAMYTSEYLGECLGRFDPQLAGVYPGDYLGAARHELPVQHVLGVGDPLAPHGARSGVDSLSEWIARERLTHLKIKLAGDPVADGRRVVSAFQVTREHGPVLAVSIDPNESYHSVADVHRMLDTVAELSEAAYRALTYLEQPFPRGTNQDGESMRGLSDRVPTVMDEGFTRLSQLDDLLEQGWSGVVIKAAKGQSPAILAYGIARARGMHVVAQDLTAVCLGLEHSAALVAALELSWPHLEYNSRQYAPGANAELGARHPELVGVRDGMVTLPEGGTGLYPGRACAG